MKTLIIDNSKNTIGLKRKTTKELKRILSSSKISFTEKLQMIQEIIFIYKCQIYGEVLNVKNYPSKEENLTANGK